MPTTTGTATDMKDLLGDLKTFALANGWTSNNHIVGGTVEDPDELYLQGAGTSVDTPVHINIKTYGDIANSTYGFNIYGAVDYNAAFALDAQPGTQSDRYAVFPTTNGSMDYWFYISDTRMIVIIKSGSSYSAFYAGFFQPLATPLEYQFPLIVMSQGSNLNSIIKFSDTLINERRGFFAPGYGQAYLRDSSGTWQLVYNWDSGYVNRTMFSSAIGAIIDQTFTQYYGNLSGFYYTYNIDNSPKGADFTCFPLLELGIASAGDDNTFYGFLEGVYPGFIPHAAAPESTFTYNSDTYRVFTGAATSEPHCNSYIIKEV